MHVEVKSLKRSMKMLGTLLITLSAITPAASVFIIMPGAVQQAGTGAFSLIAAAIISAFTAVIYAELSSAFPLTGGEYAIVGRLLGPFAGFIILGLNLFTLTLVIAVVALGIGNYIGVLFPDISAVTAGIGTVVITTLFGILNIRVNAVITGIFLVVEMLVLVTISFLGFSNISRPLSDFFLHPVYLDSLGNIGATSLSLIGLGTAVAIFAYNGYGQAVYLGEELHDAPKNIGRTILWALLIAVIAETVPIMAVLLGAPDLKTLFASQNMLSDFVFARGGATLNIIVSLGIALAILNANIAIILMQARQYFSTGRDHVWPRSVNYALTRIHKRFHSPWVATLICGALATCACFINLNVLLVMTGTGLVVIYAALCIASIAGRRKGKTKHSHYRMPLYPLPPIAGLIALVYVIYANYLDEAVGRPSLWATVGMIILSSVYYLLFLRRRGGWKLRGPID